MRKKEGLSTKNMVTVGMFTALLGVMSQLSVPMPSGMPVTLQTFAVSLTAYVLGPKLGLLSMLAYLLIGAAGVPVFAGFKGGLQALVGLTGGFLWGFCVMVLFCGIGMTQKKKGWRILFSLAGLLICHVLGTLQFMAVSGMGLAESALAASIPYFIKDILSLMAAYALARVVRKSMAASGLGLEF